MKGDPTIIRHLNTILTNELTAVNQYLQHARMLRQWGLLRLAHTIHEESVGEREHADRLITRILYLKGLPNLQDLHTLKIGGDLPEIFENDLGVESHNRACLREAITACESVRDYESRTVLESILADTEEHIDWLETQLDLIRRIGLQGYQQEQMRGN
ncbi:bacterioferritin [Azospirillum halopraeferens]|uniref:bacterioferritin n=1 Tax=Azospirillum halopraeferens TaxID=34010 RepID=UPI0003FDF608|nr:bacterioferritin [Azospirillum halopraeferens]